MLRIRHEGAAVLRKAGGGLGAFLLASFAAASAEGRTVEYIYDAATIRAAVDNQGISGPISEAPGPGSARIILETPAAADHRVIVASQYCQAYHIDNRVSVLLENLVAAANRTEPAAAGTDGRRNISLRIVSASTLLRCMGKSDVETLCKNRVRITAQASFTRSDGSIAKAPIVAQVERDGRVGGFCGNIARYTGIVTREAGIELIRQAREVTEQQSTL